MNAADKAVELVSRFGFAPALELAQARVNLRDGEEREFWARVAEALEGNWPVLAEPTP